VLLSILPGLLIYIFLQKYFVSGSPPSLKRIIFPRKDIFYGSLNDFSTNEYFVRAGNRFSIWPIQCGAPSPIFLLEEWEEFLHYRKMQGFNVLQINILPQWDRSQSDRDTLEPFHTTKSGYWDFSAPNEAYFSKAQQMGRHGL
jgi:hypothetical protein